MTEWPSRLYDLVFFPSVNERLDELAEIAEPEEWNCRNIEEENHKPILFN